MPDTFKIPIELLEQFESGNVLLFVGEGINRGLLPSAAELAAELAARCEYPAEEPLTLPRVAGYYELVRDRQGVIQFLRDRLEKPQRALPRAHALVAHLQPPVIVTTCYDRLLERALREANVSHVPVVRNAEVAYADKAKVRLVWLWGVLDQPDSLVVTEDDRRLFLEGRDNLYHVLGGDLAMCHWLFVGFDAEDAWFRAFYDSVNRGLDRQSRRAYIFGATPGAYTRAWWEKRNAEILNAEVEGFLAALISDLAARAHPVPKPRPGVLDEGEPLPEEPYKALVAYEARDRALFFGRDQEIEELTALIHAHRLVLLYGASGVGKTSLLQAGVLPRLAAADPGYVVLNARALTDPADAVRAALHRKLPEGEGAVSEDGPLVECLAAAARALEQPLVVVIDQFEEFFIRLSPEFRAAFIAELGALYDARDVPVKVVLSMREDYFARVSEIEGRIPEVFQVKQRLLPLTREQARDAIVCPAEALGYTYAPALADRLLDDLTREGVMPPQLQLVCRALFRYTRAEERQTLTLADYESLGGAQGVLTDYLDEELRRFPPAEQALARDVLEELVTSECTKKVETLAELEVALAAEADALRAVVETLVRARLLRPVERAAETGREAQKTETVLAYELAHEYLIGKLALSAEAVARKEAEELLRQGVDNDRRFSALLADEAFALIDAQRDRLRLDAEAQDLLLRSALRYGRSVGYWLARMEDGDHALALAQKALLAPDGDAARQGLGETAQDVAEGTPERLHALVARLATVWQEAKGEARAYVSDTLWELRAYVSRALRARVALYRSRTLVRRAALVVAGLLGVAFVIGLIVWRPEIQYFTAPGSNVGAGQPVTVSWKVINTRHLELQPSPGVLEDPDAGTYTFEEGFAEPVTLVLVAQNPLDTAVMSHTLRIITRPEIEWVDVAAGTFTMGIVDDWNQEDEQPPHEVTLDAYAIMKYEVTNAQYARCIEATVCEGEVDGLLADPDMTEHPVVNVTWLEARTFCEWVGGRLPTEAEWEYAARGPEGLIYPWGNDFECQRGNFDDETVLTDEAILGQVGCDGYERTAPVGSFPSGVSWCGAYDMAGNVLEWVSDWYAAEYYATSPSQNPTGPETGDYRVVRGGSWWDNNSENVQPALLRGAFRNRNDPIDTYDNLGFRCARGSP